MRGFKTSAKAAGGDTGRAMRTSPAVHSRGGRHINKYRQPA